MLFYCKCPILDHWVKMTSFVGKYRVDDIAEIIQDWSDDDEIDVAIVPPDNDELSEEEYLDEDCLTSQNISDVVGDLEVTVRGKSTAHSYFSSRDTTNLV